LPVGEAAVGVVGIGACCESLLVSIAPAFRVVHCTSRSAGLQSRAAYYATTHCVHGICAVVCVCLWVLEVGICVEHRRGCELERERECECCIGSHVPCQRWAALGQAAAPALVRSTACRSAPSATPDVHYGPGCRRLHVGDVPSTTINC
jgi:hypothetical protein